MPIQELMKLKDSKDTEKCMSVMMVIHSAPLLKGSRAACIMTVTGKEYDTFRKLLLHTGISHYLLKHPGKNQGSRYILYLYRKQELIRYLNRQDVMEFLLQYGYHCGDETITAMLQRLSDRIHLYGNGTSDFPHEIGAFLEYPIPDVTGFLENKGKNYQYSGYWKVYHDLQGAMQKFHRYDMERENAVREILDGKTIREIAV